MKLLIVLALLVSVAMADEVEKDKFGGIVQQHPDELALRWELTIVKGNDLIDLPHRFATQGLCVGLGINYVRADKTLKGFICEEEDEGS